MWNPNALTPTRKPRWTEPTAPTQTDLPPLASTAWKELRTTIMAKIDAVKSYSERIERHSELMQLWADFHAVGVQVYPAPDEENTPAVQLMALAACVTHTPQNCKALHAMRVLSEDADSVTFEAPSASRAGLFYRPVLSKRSLTVECHCDGTNRTGKCWHQTAAKELYVLMDPAMAQPLITIDNMIDAMFDACDDLSDAMPEYPSEAAKPERQGSLTAEKRAVAAANNSFDYVSYFES